MNQFERVLGEYANNGGGIGAAVCITHQGKVLYRGAAGYADVEGRRPFRCEDGVRIFSMTKMLTAVSALKLYEQGHFQLDDPVHLYLPAFRDARVLSYQNSDRPTIRQACRDVTIRHLFTMSAGYAYPEIAVKAASPRRHVDGGAFTAKAFQAAREWEQTSGQPLTTLKMAEFIAEVPMCFEPGEGWIYGLSADILGAVVVAVSGKNLGEFIRDEICVPLGMTDTTFQPSQNQLANAATIYGFMDPSNIRPINPGAGGLNSSVKGAATESLEICVGGMYSTLDDFSKFMQMLAGRGTVGGTRILGRKTVELMAMDHLTPQQYADFKSMWYPQGYATWGLMTRVSTTLNNARLPLFPGSFGWAGAAGTVACADPNENLSITFMTQRIPSDSYGVVSKLMQVAYGVI